MLQDNYVEEWSRAKHYHVSFLMKYCWEKICWSPITKEHTIDGIFLLFFHLTNLKITMFFILVQALMLYYGFLHCTPSFFFDPAILPNLQVSIVRVYQSGLSAKLGSQKTLFKYKLELLESMGLGMCFFLC